MLYELRIYHIYPGKMTAIHDRFNSVTLDLFEKHEIKLVDFWEDAQGQNTLYYILEYSDMETRNERWNAFATDPQWLTAKAISETNGPIVEKIEQYFMNRATFSRN